ncbi:MAG TPA: copper chaperone PCu(A)C [Rudaea sp.]
MRPFYARYASALLVGALYCSASHATGRLEIDQAWIRSAPPGAMMLAGYAVLRNSGDAPLTVVGAQGVDFGSVSLHQSVEENGVEQMRPLGPFSIAPGTSVVLAPGGKHLMLMRPHRALTTGDSAEIRITMQSGDSAVALFQVRDASP